MAPLPAQRGAEAEDLLHRLRVGHAPGQAVRHHPHREHHPQCAACHTGEHAHLPPLGLPGAEGAGVSAHTDFHHGISGTHLLPEAAAEIHLQLLRHRRPAGHAARLPELLPPRVALPARHPRLPPHPRLPHLQALHLHQRRQPAPALPVDQCAQDIHLLLFSCSSSSRPWAR